MTSIIQVYFQTQGENARLIGLQKTVDYVISSGLMIQRDGVYGKIYDVVIREDGIYTGRISEVVAPPVDSWELSLNNFKSNGWSEFKL